MLLHVFFLYKQLCLPELVLKTLWVKVNGSADQTTFVFYKDLL